MHVCMFLNYQKYCCVRQIDIEKKTLRYHHVAVFSHNVNCKSNLGLMHGFITAIIRGVEDFAAETLCFSNIIVLGLLLQISQRLATV